MTDLRNSLGTPGALARARTIAHRAVQLLTAAARANLEAAPDDSHSSIDWSPSQHRFLSQPLPVAGGDCVVGLAPTALMLEFRDGSGDSRYFALPGRLYSEALDWLDEQLAGQELAPASGAKIPYELPSEVAALDKFPTGQQSGLSALAAWYSLAQDTLSTFVEHAGDLDPGPGPIRCWPHHFDLATYVALETGDAETARGIGVGLSPGDESYAVPYFYVNPWPHVDPATLPPAVAPGHWHTEGFVGAVATLEEVFTLDDIETGMEAFVSGAFEAGRKALFS